MPTTAIKMKRDANGDPTFRGGAGDDVDADGDVWLMKRKHYTLNFLAQDGFEFQGPDWIKIEKAGSAGDLSELVTTIRNKTTIQVKNRNKTKADYKYTLFYEVNKEVDPMIRNRGGGG